MAGVTVPYGLETPIGGENVSVALMNRNFTKINEALSDGSKVAISRPTSKNSSWDMTGSEFVRISEGSSGIVFANLTIKCLTQFLMSSVSGSGLGLSAPAGFRFKKTSLWVVAVASGVAVNQSAQLSIEDAGSIQLRNNNANGSTTKDSYLNAYIFGEWDGAK